MAGKGYGESSNYSTWNGSSNPQWQHHNYQAEHQHQGEGQASSSDWETVHDWRRTPQWVSKWDSGEDWEVFSQKRHRSHWPATPWEHKQQLRQEKEWG